MFYVSTLNYFFKFNTLYNAHTIAMKMYANYKKCHTLTIIRNDKELLNNDSPPSLLFLYICTFNDDTGSPRNTEKY